jgi:hypothetical protein
LQSCRTAMIGVSRSRRGFEARPSSGSIVIPDAVALHVRRLMILPVCRALVGTVPPNGAASGRITPTRCGPPSIVRER